MTKQEKIEAAQKRIEELRKLISEWTKRWLDHLMKLKKLLIRLLGEFHTGELVGRRLRLALEDIKKQIIIAEQEQDQWDIY